MRVDHVVAFIKAREAHRFHKENGVWPHGMSPNLIIERYRFTNINRNDDRVTKFVLKWAAQWPAATPEETLFVLLVARLFNQPDTLDAIAQYLLPFKPKPMRKLLHARRDNGEKNFNAAYIVSTNGQAMDKVDYLSRAVLEPFWKFRRQLHAYALPGGKNTLEDLHARLSTFNGLASFMAAQVIADYKYLIGGEEWSDFHTFAASGPGSKRGLNRVMRRDLNDGWRESDFRETLLLLRGKVNAKLKWKEPLTAQNLQNTLCEFDKMERARLGQGKPKQIYTPHEEN